MKVGHLIDITIVNIFMQAAEFGSIYIGRKNTKVILQFQSLPRQSFVIIFLISCCFRIFRMKHRRCSIKKLFLKITQYLQENTCAGVSL